MNKLRIGMAAVMLAFAGAACAFDFRSIGDAPAVMYDGPNHKTSKRFIAPPGMPVEVIHTQGNWTKVRDAAGDLIWVESKLISSKRTVVVTIANGKIRAKAEESAPIVFTADKGVLLEVAEPVASGWIKVKHKDGQTGFVRASDVWGA